MLRNDSLFTLKLVGHVVTRLDGRRIKVDVMLLGTPSVHKRFIGRSFDRLDVEDKDVEQWSRYRRVERAICSCK